jgi:hypothetical protein
VINILTGDDVRWLTGHFEPVLYVTLSQGGRICSSADRSGGLHFWSVNSYSESILVMDNRLAAFYPNPFFIESTNLIFVC